MKNRLQKRCNFLILVLALTLLSTLVQTAAAQTTAFNFQGRLNDGSSPANGKYDLEFRLYDALTSGNQVGSTVSKSNLTLVNGVFSTPLNFGAAAFNGGDRFIKIGLRRTTTGNATPNAFVILGPRQQILSVPYSIRSLRSTLADDATHAVNADNATNAANSSSLGDVPATGYLQKNGDGSQLTNVTAVNSQQLGGVAASQYVQKGTPGLPKATALVKNLGSSPPDFQIVTCYNSTLSGSAATTPPCGFSVNYFTVGGFGFNFGFDVWDRPISLATTVRSEQVGYPPHIDYYNMGIYYSFPNSDNHSVIDIRTYKSGDSTATADPIQYYQQIGGFSVIVY